LKKRTSCSVIDKGPIAEEDGGGKTNILKITHRHKGGLS